MYCNSCGKEIPDKSQFCLFCGKAIMVVPSVNYSQPAPIEWEYKQFSWDWKRGKGGQYHLGLGQNEPMARLFFWGNDQGRILPDLQTYIDQGWQPVSEVGPNAYIFHRHQGNPDWLEIAAFRVRLRRQRLSPLTNNELKVIGKWQHTGTTGGNLIMKMAQGLASMVGGQVIELEFTRELLFTAYASNRSISGVFSFTDDHHLSLISDPPKFFSVTAELNGMYDSMVIHDMGGLQAHYRKA